MSETKKPTALVTGACGFIGSHMVDYLLGQGYKVTATDTEQAFLLASVYNKHAVRRLSDPFCEFLAANLNNPKSLEEIFKTEFNDVFAVASVFDYTKPPQLLYQVNVEGMFNLLNAIKNAEQSPKIV